MTTSGSITDTGVGKSQPHFQPQITWLVISPNQAPLAASIPAAGGGRLRCPLPRRPGSGCRCSSYTGTPIFLWPAEALQLTLISPLA